MQYVRRTKEGILRSFLESPQSDKPVLIVSGARQVGKTTLIERALAEIRRKVVAINLEKALAFADKIDRTEDFDAFEKLLADEQGFCPTAGAVLFIDEAQTSQKLGSYVRFMKEAWRAATVILSGSLISEMHDEKARTPVGREKFLELWPFTFKEFLSAVGHDALAETVEHFALGGAISELSHARLLEDYGLYVKIGGLPAVIEAFRGSGSWQDTILDIYKTYEDDFIRYFGIDKNNLFGRALSAVAVHVGSPSKNSQVIKVDAPGYKKVNDILARLERWQLVLKVEQLGKAPEQFHFPPKRYLYDPGVLNYLRFRGRPDFGIGDASDVFLRTALGGTLENAIALALKNQVRDVVGVKLSKSSEVDFGVKLGTTFLPIECKSSRTFKLQHAYPVINYCKLFKAGCGVVLNLDMPRIVERDHIKVYSLPLYLADEITRLFRT